MLNDRPLWPPGAEIAAQAFDAFDAWRCWFDPECEWTIEGLVEAYSQFGHCRVASGGR